MALSVKNVPDTLQDLKGLLISYAKQETVDPLKNLGRYLGFGLAGMALITLGTFFLAMSLLRFLQTMIGGVFDGFWSWVPYVIVMVLLAGAIAQARFVPLDSRNHLMLERESAWQRWTEEVAQFMDAPVAVPAAAQTRLVSLTPRERELLALIAQGRDNAQIGAVLGLSDKTVRNHITSIFAKLAVENRPQAIVLARSAGLGMASGYVRAQARTDSAPGTTSSPTGSGANRSPSA